MKYLIEMKVLLICALSIVFGEVFTLANSINTDLNDEWELYKIKYQKSYKNMDEYSRRLIWEENIKYIEKHNIQYNLNQHTYFLGINQFTDMTNEEFKEKYLRIAKPKAQKETVTFMSPLNLNPLPATVNWVKKGYVTPVKNQGQCGSCWTFSTTGSVEGQYFRKTKKLLSFSEQQIVDCSKSYGTFGCNGGWMDDAMDYIQKYGIEKEKDYKYTAQDGICKYNASKVVTKISGHVDVKANDEQALAVAVATQGPISVAIDASHPSFQSYSGGIYNEPNCSKTILDHAVLVVGYSSVNGNKYWLVKNSWGTMWGLDGYIQMSKDNNNQCGIAAKASFPTM